MLNLDAAFLDVPLTSLAGDVQYVESARFSLHQRARRLEQLVQLSAFCMAVSKTEKKKFGAFGPVPNDVWRLQGSAGTQRSVCSSADCIPVESCDDAPNCPGMRPLATRLEFTLLKARFTAARSVGFKHRFYTW